MVGRGATWLGLAVGGTAGAWAALVNSSSTPPAAAAPQLDSPLAEPGAIVEHPAEVTGTGPTRTSAASSSAADPTAAAIAVKTSAPNASESAKSAAPPPAADLLPLPTTKATLLRQEMRCDQRKAEACIVAARSYESGSAGVTDLAKAAKYRRIALTALISKCDHNSAAACLTLATMYRAGSSVPQSDRNADALFARARELCRFNDGPACHELPDP